MSVHAEFYIEIDSSIVQKASKEALKKAEDYTIEKGYDFLIYEFKDDPSFIFIEIKCFDSERVAENFEQEIIEILKEGKQ